MPKFRRDQTKDELRLMMGGRLAAGMAGGVPLIGAIAFNTSYQDYDNFHKP
ncbi:hypothetical protein [Anabaena sp. CCY 0017]|uniref:hypothetical protein n=1 Tax=Anabaena sp. CCY 0017 TaxID=3103866 RepID=UPI0039C68C67